MRWLAALAACSVSLLLPAAAGADSPVSAHAMVHACCTPYGMKERAFAESKALGANVIRVDVEMGPIFELFGQPRPQPDWHGLDEVIELSQRYDLPVLGIVLDTPSFLSTCPKRWPNAGHCAAADAGEYGRLAGELAAHARGAVAQWEIVNEPDGQWAFEGSAEQYARMLASSYDAIKARAPEARVAMGGVMTPTSPSWVERVFATPGTDAEHKYDIANMHIRGRVGDLARGVAGWRALLGRHGFRGPLWVTEHGYSADPAYQQDPAYVGGEPAQAGYLRHSLLALAEAGAGQVFVTLRDNPTLEPKYVSEGLVDIQETSGYPARRRPSFEAVRRLGQRWPELRALLAEQRGHEWRAAQLSQLAAADETRLRQWRSGRGDVSGALRATRRVIRRVSAARSSRRRRAQLALARRQERRLRGAFKRFDLRVRGYAQRVAGNRLEAFQHALAALDCARRIDG